MLDPRPSGATATASLARSLAAAAALPLSQHLVCDALTPSGLVSGQLPAALLPGVGWEAVLAALDHEEGRGTRWRKSSPGKQESDGRIE